jgi:hypothetical protein
MTGARMLERSINREPMLIRTAAWRWLVVAAAALLVVFVPRAGAASWAIQPAAVPPEPNGDLAAVSCPTTGWCAAVGSFTDHSSRVRPLFEISTGRRWRLARTTDSPDLTAPVHSASGSLVSVSCASPVACVAVGNAGYARGFSGLAARWNGRRWSAMRAPPSADDAVSCVSRSVCVAVGDGAARWNGVRWKALRVARPKGSGVRLTSVSCPSAKECFAAGEAESMGTAVGVLERLQGTRWTVQRAAVGEDYGQDFSSAAVSCASANRCVAIVHQRTFQAGDDSGTSTWFADVWNGHRWSKRSAPAADSISCVPGLCATIGSGPPAVLDRHGWHTHRSAVSPQFLRSVSCASIRMCVAVGGASRSAFPQSGVLVTTPSAIRWNGSRWSRVTPVLRAGARPTELHGVACASARFCMAVGAIYLRTSTRPLAETWAGRRWHLVNPPVPTGGGALESVSCVSPRHCVAVGINLKGAPIPGYRGGALIEAWNGSSWSAQPTPPLPGLVELSSVSCASPSRCVAVGLIANRGFQPLIERWNGRHWTIDQQTSPNAFDGACSSACDFDFQTLTGVACASASACQAVGSTQTFQGTTTFAETWNGVSWAPTPTPNPAPAPTGDRLTAVSCTTPTACVAVGSGQNNVFAERWDGKRWSLHGNHRGAAATPHGISCNSRSRCEVVGESGRPQAWLWNGLRSAAQKPPGLPTASLESVACPSASDCFAVGGSPGRGPDTLSLSASLIERFG